MKQGTKLPPASRWAAYLALSALSLLFMLPFAWLVSTALKPDAQIMKYPPDWIPQPMTFEHFQKGLLSVPFGFYLLNTLGIAITVIGGTLLSCSLVAYSFSILRWPGRNVLFFIMLATMMLPGQVTMIPIFLIFRKLGWINTFLPLIAPAFLGNAFFIFLLRQFFLTIPRELVDAARIDGCSEFRLWWQIVLPLSKPALATVGLFTFIGAWNDFLNPLIYLIDQNKYTLSLGLAMFRGQYGNQFGELMAVSTLMTAPVIVLFFFTQKTFIQGIKTSGLKG